MAVERYETQRYQVLWVVWPAKLHCCFTALRRSRPGQRASIASCNAYVALRTQSPASQPVSRMRTRHLCDHVRVDETSGYQEHNDSLGVLTSNARLHIILRARQRCHRESTDWESSSCHCDETLRQGAPTGLPLIQNSALLQHAENSLSSLPMNGASEGVRPKGCV